MARRYPIRAVARLTGLPLDTLRAWERRYAAVVPERGPRGRLYTEAQVERLRLLREAVEQGHGIGLAARHEMPELRALVASGRRLPTGGDRLPDASQAQAPDRAGLAPVITAIEALDAVEADQQLARLALMLAPRAFVYEVALPLMREAGRRWHSGEFTIAQEHLLSAALRNLLGTLIRLRAPNGAKPALLFATPSGELHEFGILVATLLAATARHGLLYLGANLPAPDVVSAAAHLGVKVVVIGLMPVNRRDATLEDVRWLARKLPASTALWVGGGDGLDLPRRRGAAPVVWLNSLEAFEAALANLD